MNGAQWVVQALQQQGVYVVFGYPGGAIMPLYDALFDSDLEHLLCRHEQGAAIAAIGYARAIGKVGVCIATSGPGATNLITGLADALMDSVPLVAITGQVETTLMGTDAFQEIDVLGLSLSCTKHSFLVPSLEALPEIISEAFLIASSGRPGPVLIDIPKDIQLAEGVLPNCVIKKKNHIINLHGSIKSAKYLMNKASRPILYIGGGVGMARAVSTLRHFIDKTSIPHVVTLKGLGTSADYHNSSYLGMLGMHGNPAANIAVQSCDLLIAVGARFDERVTGQLNTFAPNAKIIHLDIDPAEISKLRQAHVTLLGDLNTLLSALIHPLSIDPWIKEIHLLKKKYAWSYEQLGEAIYAPYLLKTISDYAPEDTIVTTDVGQHQMWTAQHMRFSLPENFITSSGLGTMGFGIPAAIGAQLARPHSMVVCISGDGSFMMNVQELATIKRKKLPIKIVLLDNKRLGMVRQWQQIFFNKRYSETTLNDNPDFLLLARAFDIPGMHISLKEEILSAINMMLTQPGPFLLHVSIDECSNVWPIVPPGAGNDTMLEKLS
ncbi:acetolactate synthase 2 catalytic subunit [Candidatus Schneideria nysicola]|uniref:acetolactate synthase 2 catalytic subunit n=1 Tax=Candidatus Schneideria nysicola TaxID=1081631 RepID=UPI001CAA6959|nr:acetolactate synthase 2 catalytic subunit [Candidatus Schneideria nysicola]UAJ65205.1 acetolactate synthase 2 catalytic subunit [Candidatus Schneideria nysicola]